EVASGKAARALAGAVEEMTPLLHALLDRFGALARPGADGAELARPFDRRRDGFLAAEGATLVHLETEESALARGARPLARVLAWGSAFDPTAPRTGWGTGAGRLARSPLRPVLVPKATVGEYGGGFLGAAVLAAGGAPFGPTPGFAEPDPELGIIP